MFVFDANSIPFKHCLGLTLSPQVCSELRDVDPKSDVLRDLEQMAFVAHLEAMRASADRMVGCLLSCFSFPVSSLAINIAFLPINLPHHSIFGQSLAAKLDGLCLF